MTGPALHERRLADGVALVFAAWILSRLLLVVLTRAHGWYPYQDDPFDLALFPQWGHAFATGQGIVPLRDAPWEYPFGAAAVVALPALTAGASYQLGFVALMLAGDAALLTVLVLLGVRRGRLDGAWLWCAAVPLLGPVALTRYDVLPTLAAVLGVAVAGVAPVASGALLVVGGTLKLWPLLLLPLTVLLLPRGRRAALGAGATALLLVGGAAWYGYGGHLLSFLTYQRDRGLEIESVPALPLLLMHLAGNREVHSFFGFGSYQVEGPHALQLARLATAGLVASGLAVAALAVRARRAGNVDQGMVLRLAALALAALLCFDKVLSAQYPLWLAGPIALELCTERSRLRPAVPLLCAVLLLTQLVYPLLIQDLVTIRSRALVAVSVRDLALTALTAQLAVLAWRLPSRASAASRAELSPDLPKVAP